MNTQLVSRLGIYALAIALASTLWPRPLILAICYALLSILVLARWHTRADVIFYGGAFVLGPAGEAVAVHSGAWHYEKPVDLIPIWLPFLWGIAALFMKKLSEALLGRRE